MFPLSGSNNSLDLNKRGVSRRFETSALNSLLWPLYIINSVDSKLPCQ